MRTGRGFLIWLPLLLLGMTSAALAHTPPSIYLTCRIDEEKAELSAVIGIELYEDWFGLPPKAYADLDEEERRRAVSTVERVFAESAVLAVDRIPVKGVFQDIEIQEFLDHEAMWKYAKVVVRYGTKGRPTQIALAWTLYENSIDWYLDTTPAEIVGFGGVQYFQLSSEEPEYVLHLPPDSDVSPAPAAISSQAVGFRFLLFAAIPLAAAFLSIAWLLSGVARLTDRSSFWAGSIGCVVIAAGVGSVLLWGPGLVKGDAALARSRFEAIHRNIYRAFDYEKEDDIYETLAKSVRGDLLERVYWEVLAGLILEDQGGAQCEVQATNILEAAVEFPPNWDPRRFEVVCKWTVLGRVGHWGHTHQRLNEYRARFAVSRQDGVWKIDDMEVLEQRRIDEPDPATERK